MSDPSFLWRLNQLQKYLRHCTVFWQKWPVHDLLLVTPPPPLIKVASNTRPYSKRGGTTLNGREEGGQYYILQTCDQERFEARKVVFPWECLIIFATGCSQEACRPLLGQVYFLFFIGKSCLAPFVKETTIPTSELTTDTVSVRLKKSWRRS